MKQTQRIGEYRKFFFFKMLNIILITLGLPRLLSDKESACRCRKLGFNLWVGKIPLRKKWQPTPVFLPRKSLGQRSLESYGP